MFRTALLLAAAGLLAACSANTVTSVVKPYRIDVRQGNAVTQEMVAHLSPGMSKEQVRFMMGSPMLVSIFRPDRWDYVYQFSQGYKPVEKRRISLFFAGDKLERVEGDVAAASGNEVPAPQAPKVIDISSPGDAPAKR